MSNCLGSLFGTQSPFFFTSKTTWLSLLYSNARPSVRSMEYPLAVNMLDSTKSSDEKRSFEDVGTPTTGTGRTASTSAANVTRFISEKLLDWGVEERGAYRIFRFPRSRL
jgi:hypothetical protein